MFYVTVQFSYIGCMGRALEAILDKFSPEYASDLRMFSISWTVS
jgi:hypothetical protein